MAIVESIALEELEKICMKMISFTGEGRAMVYEAIEAFTKGDLKLCEEKIEKAEEYLIEAHKIQFEKLLTPQAKGVEIPFNILVVHAMDLLMVSTAERDVINKIIKSGFGREVKK